MNPKVLSRREKSARSFSKRKKRFFKDILDFERKIATLDMRLIQKILSDGVQLRQGFFKLMMGGRIKIPLLAGYHWPDDGPTLNAGLVVAL